MKTIILIAAIVTASAAQGQRTIFIHPTECSSGLGLAVLDGLRARIASAPGYRLIDQSAFTVGSLEVDMVCVSNTFDTAIAVAFSDNLILRLVGNEIDPRIVIDGLFASIVEAAPRIEAQPAYVPQTKCKPNAKGVTECR